MPVIAVTGATGFVGRAAVERLRRRLPDHSLRLLVRSASSRRLPQAWSEYRIVDGHLGDDDALTALVDGADAVVHVAAAIAGNRAADFDRANVAGTRRLVDAIVSRAPGARCVLVSSLAARHPSLSWYAASKRAAEELVRTRLAHSTVIRPPAVYGPEDPALADFWRMLARGWLIRLGPRNARFSLLHVDDLADAIAAAATDDSNAGPLELSGPQPEGGWTWPELARVAAEVRGGPVRTLAVPATALRTLSAAGMAWGRARRRPTMLTPGKARELLHPDWVCDNLPTDSGLDWRPATPLERALGTLPGWTPR